MILTPRLALAARLCRPPCRLIDVGCDHGYLTIGVMEAGALGAVATDIRHGPLDKARQNLQDRGYGNRVRLLLTDGLAGLSPGDGDTIAICGMGGETIANILAAAPWTNEGRHRLVLQPMTRGEKLRIFLHEAGYQVEEEALAREGARLYAVLAARGGGGAPVGEQPAHGLFTTRMPHDPLFGEYLSHLRRRYRRMLAGIRRGGDDPGPVEAILKILDETAEEYAH